MTIVCGDSHTSTHGAFGALAFGIGTSEVEARAGDSMLAANQTAHDESSKPPDDCPRELLQKISPWESSARSVQMERQVT
mgnify:CR=1 FL=1